MGCPTLRHLTVFAVAAALLASRGAAAQSQGPEYRPTGALDDGTLSSLIWDHAPTLAAARAQVDIAKADVRRSHLLPNPTLDAAWSTIPIGEPNPSDLKRPLAHIPNYSVGISQLFEIGKRGNRQRAARESLTANGYDAYAQLADAYFATLDQVGIIAAAQLRASNLQELLVDSAALTTLQRQRVAKGDAAALDADRAALEETKLRTQYDEEVARLADAIRVCSEIVGVACAPFAQVDQAVMFLGQAPPQDGDRLLDRPDLQALEHQRLSALAQRDLASNKAIPDPTVRFGYLRDQFVISGNQQNSLFVGVSIPLPIADHGQADVLEADAVQNGAAAEYDRRTAAARTAVARLSEQRTVLAERRSRMREQTLPQARGIVRDLTAVVSRGGASLQELLLARRTLGELLLDAGELDRVAFNIELALARTRGWAPPPPGTIQNDLKN